MSTVSAVGRSAARSVIPRRVLFGNADRLNPALSPDGTLLGYAAPHEGVMNIWIEPVDGSAPARPVTRDRGRGITEFTLCTNGRMVYRQDNDGDENWRLYLLDLPDPADDTGDDTDVRAKPRLVTPEHGIDGPVQALVLAYHPLRHPDQMLLAVNADHPQLYDIHMLDLATGELTTIETNPGHTGNPPFASWLADTDLQVRGGVVPAPDGGILLHVRDESGQPWRPLLHLPADDITPDTSLTFTHDGASLIMVSSLGASSGRLARVDLADGKITTITEDPDHDVSQVWLDATTGEPVVAVHAPDRNRYQVLDPAFTTDLKQLTSLDDGDVSLIGSARGGRLLLAATTAPDAPVRYYLYDRDTEQSQLLFHQRDDLTGYRLAPMETFDLVARDGLVLHGYLTRPLDAPDGPLPAVLLVHGGPWVRDTWKYHAEAQWLANRGYAVIQVNYRGSSGYGKAHMSAGDRQWGRAMQTDLLDTVTHLIEQGVIDADRVGIYGGSYGGYTALCGAAFGEDFFACAVSACGPTDLATLINSIPPQAQPMIKLYHARIGHPDRDADRLREVSPSAHAHNIRTPLLVAQGANDPRVPLEQADALIAALDEHDIPHRYLVFDNEGHGLTRPENRETFYSQVEAFLAEHLGGACQETTSPS